MISTTAVAAGVNPDLVQRLFRKADTNGDGHVSPAEFQAFMTSALATPAGQQAFMAIAQHLPATPASLQQIANTLGPTVGHIEPDGKTFALAGSMGAIGIRDTGHGPAWQYLPAHASVTR